MTTIEHLVPQVGYVKLKLYEPAISFYKRAQEKGEINRLKSLMHLGSLSINIEGAKFSRWDYTVAMLYYIDILNVKGFNSRFRIGEIKFSSAKSALQLLCLCWNVGHLPGTFSTERGLFNYMFECDADNAASKLNWSFKNEDLIQFIIKMANLKLKEEGYYAISKVLAVKKCISWCHSIDDEFFDFVKYFISPILLDYTFFQPTKQWAKITESFRMIRHLAYLTIDSQFSGDTWIPSIPMFFSTQQQREVDDIFKLSSKISEYLSPIELNIYERIYHSERARNFSATFSKVCFDILKKERSFNNFVEKLLSNSGPTENMLELINNAENIQRVITLKFRSHYSDLRNLAKVEQELRSKGFNLSATYKYHSWNSDEIMEPDEYIIDVLKEGDITSVDLAKILVWVIDTLDCQADDHKDHYAISVKSAIEGIYREILQKFLSQIIEPVIVSLESWPLRDFSRFPEVLIKNNSGVAWSSNATLDDKIIKHIVRDTPCDIEPHQRDLYKELLGLREFRIYQKNEMKSKKWKCRWIFFTSSIVISRSQSDIMEFDGGVIKVSSRGNKISFFGLETKNGNENPSKSLRKKLERNGINCNIQSINPSHSFCEITHD